MINSYRHQLSLCLGIFIPLLIGSRAGKIYRLEPPYTRAGVLVELEDYPHSVAYRDGELLMARTDGLYRADFRPGQTHIERDTVELLAALPSVVIGFFGMVLSGPVLVREEYRLALLVGLFGGFTTFSTFGWETFSLLNDGEWWRAFANFVLSNVGGVMAVWIGYRLAERWYGG